MQWNRVLTLEIFGANGKTMRVANTKEAAACLLRDWPKKSGYYYLRAVKGCAKALKGELDDADARFYFHDAALDANMRVQVSLGPAVLPNFDTEIAEICDALAFELFGSPRDNPAVADSPQA